MLTLVTETCVKTFSYQCSEQLLYGFFQFSPTCGTVASNTLSGLSALLFFS